MGLLSRKKRRRPPGPPPPRAREELVWLDAKDRPEHGEVLRLDDRMYGAAIVSTLGERGLQVPAKACNPWTPPLSGDQPLEPASGARAWLRVQARMLASAAQLGAATNIKIVPLPHQLLAVHKFVTLLHAERGPARILFADEPGMGKTSEALLAYTLLHRQGLAGRTLFLTPPRVAAQWATQLRERFGHRNVFLAQDSRNVRRILGEVEVGLCSLDLAKLGEHPDILAAQPWDLIVIDEAHHLTPGTQRYALAKRLLAPRGPHPGPKALLLTATPHSGNLRAFLGLLHLLEPSLLPDPDNPATRLTETEAQRLLERSAPELSARIAHSSRADAIDNRGGPLFPKPDVRFRVVESPTLERLGDAIGEHFGGRKAAGFLRSTYQRMAGSSFAALRRGLKARLAATGSKKQVSGEEGVPGTERFADGESAQDRLAAQGRAGKTEACRIEALLKRVPPDTKDPKLAVLLQLLEGAGDDKVLVFVEFRATQDFLKAQLERRYGKGCCAVIRGGMGLGESIKQMRRFEGPSRFMVATDAGSEGIDLQFASAVINYDLPWNPMRLEQRIGRIYRYGASGRAKVVNLVATAQDRVHQRLRERIAELAADLQRVGLEGGGRPRGDIELQLLGAASQQDELADLLDQTRQTQDPDTQRRLEEVLQRAKRAWSELQGFLGSLPPPDPEALRDLAGRGRLDELPLFVQRFLHETSGGRLQQGKDRSGVRTYAFAVPSVLDLPQRNGERYTVDYQAALSNDELRLLAAGDEAVDAMVRHCCAVPFGGHVGQLAVKLPELGRFRGLGVFWLVGWQLGDKAEMTRLVPVVLDQQLRARPDIAARLERSLNPRLDSRADFGFARQLLRSPGEIRSAAEHSLRAHPLLQDLERRGVRYGTRVESVLCLANVP